MVKIRFKRQCRNAHQIGFQAGQVVSAPDDNHVTDGLNDDDYEVLDAPAPDKNDARNPDGGDENSEVVGTGIGEPPRNTAVKPPRGRGKGK